MTQLFEVKNNKIPKNLREQFLIPPLSLLDAKSGYWATKKRRWEKLLGDSKNNIRNTTARSNTPYINQFIKEDFIGMKSPNAGNISTFDPFLCEILIRWFSKKGMTIYDPFAGGIVRGAVAGILGRNYWGIDICKEQVLHNKKEWIKLLKKYKDIESDIHWIEGDSEKDNSVSNMDMLLTCPPYYNLEHYTDDKNDLSNQRTYDDFIDKYTTIIKKCYNILVEDSFAVIVVEEIRDKNGELYGFVPDTIQAFKQAGFHYYNELILENRIVSTAIRSKKYFIRSRKVGRHHQNVLVFYKGDLNNVETKFGGETI